MYGLKRTEHFINRGGSVNPRPKPKVKKKRKKGPTPNPEFASSGSGWLGHLLNFKSEMVL